jgi:hypothetical protein
LRILQVERNGFLADVGRDEVAAAVVVDHFAADVAVGIARQAVAAGVDSMRMTRQPSWAKRSVA